MSYFIPFRAKTSRHPKWMGLSLLVALLGCGDHPTPSTSIVEGRQESRTEPPPSHSEHSSDTRTYPAAFFESDDEQHRPNVPLLPKEQVRPFYAIQEPRTSGYLDVGGGDKIYYEVSGNPQGKPVVFVHGGPGWHSQPKNRGWFDPAVYNIVLFDQRGTGKSLPVAGDTATPPDHYAGITVESQVADMDALRRHLGIDKWLVFGGSWGSTLSLSYAEAHPDRIHGLVLRGIYLGTPVEHDAIYYGSMPQKHPVAWGILQGHLAQHPQLNPEQRKARMIPGYRELVMKGDAVAMGIWSLYEEYVMTPSEADGLRKDMETLAHHPTQKDIDSLVDVDRRTTAIMEVLLFTDLEAKRRLLDPEKLRKIQAPITVVQGAEDAICPPRFADGLVESLRGAGVQVDYQKVPTGEHEPDKNDQMRTRLLNATDAMARR